MPTQSPPSKDLRDLYASDSKRFQRQFSAAKDGLGFLQQRYALVESIALRLWQQLASPEKGGPSRFVRFARGDLGRQSLFPYSEVDLLLLSAAEDTAEKFSESARRFS